MKSTIEKEDIAAPSVRTIIKNILEKKEGGNANKQNFNKNR